MVNKINFKLGKKAYRKDKRDLMWKSYVDMTVFPQLPNPPFGHADLITDWLMLANDQLGDCVIAGACHSSMLDNAEAGKSITFTDQNAIAVYSAACGYNPSDPNTDQGCEIRTVLGYCQRTGLKDANGDIHRIDAYVSLDQANLQDIYESIYLFGKAKLGIQVPQSAIDQSNAGKPWTVVHGSKILGGHDVEAVKVLANGSLQVITWGKTQEMTLPFFKKYCDEAWSPLSKEMLTNKGVSLEGFNWTQLEADLAAISTAPKPTPTPPPITKISTHIAVNPVSGQKKEQINLTADLVDTQNNLPVTNKKVSFAVSKHGHALISVGNTLTDSTGSATLPYKIIQQHRGNYPISAQFAGDDTYASTIGNNILTVGKASISISPISKDPLDVIKQIQKMVSEF